MKVQKNAGNLNGNENRMSLRSCTPLERFDHSGQAPSKNKGKIAMCKSTVNTQGNCMCAPSPVAPLQPFAHFQHDML